MQINHTQHGTKGHFFVGDENNHQAEMTYTLPSADKMIIDHTEVDDALRGQNVGNQLLNAAIEHARAHHMKIIPLCPFANSVFKKKPELRDILA